MFKLRTSLLAVIIVLLFEAVISDNFGDTNGTNEFSPENGRPRVLSRRKRFLIFPDGSSLQLVFCVQTAALIPIGDIFLFGNTAALAWTLPSDPMFLAMLKGKEAQRRGDTKNIKYLDEAGRVIASVPYRRRPIVNPAFAKRSIDENISYLKKLKIRLDKIKMHQDQSEREYLKRDGLDTKSIEFHRNSRLELFGKLEKLLQALGQDGRQCVLYKLCEAAQRSEQGTFLQEFLRAVFTLPKGYEFDEEYHREYDKAHTLAEDCIQKYPDCVDFAK